MRGSVDEDIESGLGEDASALDLEGVGSNTTHVRVLIAETVMMVLKLVSIIVRGDEPATECYTQM